MNNCSADEHCGTCSDGRNKCLIAENRCIACDPNTGEGCADGEECTGYGICAPEGQTCETDTHGEPTKTCSSDTDCRACSPMHQVCDGGRCTACTSGNTEHCLNSDICLEGKCSPKCPMACESDNDCNQCGSEEAPAKACHKHRCSECSDTYPCPAGEKCQDGTCVKPCGIAGSTPGDCDSDDDCQACGGQNGNWVCNKPVNDNHGTCGPAAAGCSDLGTSVAVLPDPWDRYTNLCSNDNDCGGVGIDLNVGKLIRDVIGTDEIDLGFTEIEITDANVHYGMNRCANIDIRDDLSCGVCVPCKQDSDCAPINIDNLIFDLFSNDPLAALAGALLIDLAFGDQQDHNFNFRCQDVAFGYGVCAPCTNPFQACGQNVGSSGGSGTCHHSPCAQGTALDQSCSSCTAAICADDPYCCDTAWDQQCVDSVASYCGAGACVGDGAGTCFHSECSPGAALDAGCSSCAAAVCAADDYCCEYEWDAICVEMVEDECGANACSGTAGECVHSECTEGGKLSYSCSSCAAAVCDYDPYCCDTAWDEYCVESVYYECSETACNAGGACTHGACTEGGPLDDSCGSCEADVCDIDPYCCQTEWDFVCMQEMNDVCGAGTCYTCAHDEFQTGEALDPVCSQCAEDVCAEDGSCCNPDWDWDSTCVNIAYTKSSCN